MATVDPRTEITSTGLIFVDGHYFTPDEADAFAEHVVGLATESRRRAAAEVCAREGHQLNGFDAYRSWPDGPIHVRWCDRGCGLEETLEGHQRKARS